MKRRLPSRAQRNQEVARTGQIPPGSQIHVRKLRNLPSGAIQRRIHNTEALLAAGKCHPAWGAKQLERLRDMLAQKATKVEKKYGG